MGLDISFKKTEADAAGMVFKRDMNGTMEQIKDAITQGDDAEYITWLRDVVDVITVPATSIKVMVSFLEDSVFIRANKWGGVYYPLTDWLKKNDIKWEES